MTDDFRAPDVLVIGDSHSAAIKAGCDANALRAEILAISGNFWHVGAVVPHPAHGLWAKMAAPRQMILAMKERMGGGSVFLPDVPVIASIGFHLGRLAPPLMFKGNVTDPDEFRSDPESLFVSSGFVEAYAAHYRKDLLALLQTMAAQVPLVVVAPPDMDDRPGLRAVRSALIRIYRKAGIHVFDPCEHAPFDKLSPLPPEYLSADKVHGNARYGREVIAALLQEGAARLERAG